MNRVAFYRWRIVDRVTGKLRLTRYRMTEADAMQRHPGAIKDEGSVEWIELPETDAERIEQGQSMHTAATNGRQNESE